MGRPKPEADRGATTLTSVEEGAARPPSSRRSGSTPPAPAERIADRYEIVGLLGMGGMGSVYRVRDLELGELVALKFLRRELLDSPGMLERFRQEVRLARKVTHVNVARTFDIGEHDGERFLTMELIDGESLTRVLEREGPLSPRRAIELGRDLCAGLAAAHAAGVIHRDLKPDNVLLDRGGRAVITDFGIARAEKSGAPTVGFVGTAAYMAPEQVEGLGEVDGRADLYALGTLLFEAVTGERAWTGESFLSVAVARLRQPPPDPRARNPHVPDALAAVISRCMATDRDARFATAREVADALAEAAGALPEAQATPSRGPAEPGSTATRALRVAPAPAAGDTTLAVLPFTHVGGDDAVLADALTDDLIDALSATRGLRVRPRGMVALYRSGETADPRALGRALDVQVIVEGSFRRRGGDVRVTARLISVADGFQLWARRFDRPARDLLAINDEVAHSVAEALTVELALAPRPSPPDADAVELYLRARLALRDAWSGHQDLEPAVTLFEQGLARAPDDPGLLSGYAMARARRLNYAQRDADDPAAVMAAADRALAAAPHLGEPWLARATVLYVTSDWTGAVLALRTALDRAPGLTQAHEMLAYLLLEIGRLEEGLERLETVVSLDPTAATPRWELARASALAGRWERVDVLLALPVDSPAERAGRRVTRARLNLWRGAARHDVSDLAADADPIAAFYDAVMRTPGAAPDELVPKLASWIARLRPGSRLRPLCAQFGAELCAASGRDEEAIGFVSDAVELQLYDLSWLDRCPLLAPVRGDRRFAEARARVAERIAAISAALDAPWADRSAPVSGSRPGAVGPRAGRTSPSSA